MNAVATGQRGAWLVVDRDTATETWLLNERIQLVPIPLLMLARLNTLRLSLISAIPTVGRQPAIRKQNMASVNSGGALER